MRKKYEIENRKCEMCGCSYKPNGSSQRFCAECSYQRKLMRNREFYKKNHPNMKPKYDGVCCVCGEKFSAFFDGKPYCNKHWLRLYNNGSLEKKKMPITNKYEFMDDAIRIITANGDVIIADLEDYNVISKSSWCLLQGKYPVARINGKTVRMSRLLVGDVPDGMVVDHINGDTLDNRKANLRICTPRQNSLNTADTKNRTLPKGVSKSCSNRYRARIMVNGKEIWLGTFSTVKEAEQARMEAEIEYYKEFSTYVCRKKGNLNVQLN